MDYSFRVASLCKPVCRYVDTLVSSHPVKCHAVAPNARMTNHASALLARWFRVVFFQNILILPPPLMEPHPSADEEAAEEVAAEVQESFKVSQVIMVSCVRTGQSVKQWLPDTQIVSGMLFGCCCKWDSSFIRMVTGKGLALHKKREANNLNVKLWADIAAERARITAVA